MSSPVQGSYPVQPPKNKIHPIVWVLIGLAGCVLLVIMAIVAGGIYVASRVAANPSEIAALIAAQNPDFELVTSNNEKGTFTLREKSTGKTMTLRFDEMKGGRVTFTGEEDGKEVRVEAGPDGIRVKSADGKEVEIGAKPQ